MSFGTHSGKKDNSRRKFPGIGGRRRNPVGIKARRLSASERVEAYAKLTAEQKLATLDARLGAGVGAKRQRVRLAREIASRVVVKKTK